MRARILPPTAESIAQAAESLRLGQVVGMPTETVYGLAGAALRPDALARIFDAKERPTFDPLIVHVRLPLPDRTIDALERMGLVDGSRLATLARARATALMERFWPGPLTLVLPKSARVPDLATSGLPSVALRMPEHPVAQALIDAAGTPLAAPSANRFGRISPTSAQAVAEELGDRIDWILDGGPCRIGVESTVVRIDGDGTLTQLRPGGLPRSAIEEAAGTPVAIAGSTSSPARSGGEQGPQASPGMLESHYAPSRPMWMLPSGVGSLRPSDWRRVAERAQGVARLGFLLQSGDPAQASERILASLREEGGAQASLSLEILSPSGDLHEAARSLFARMRALDASGAQALFAEPCAVDRGLGHAIADRLGRACRGRL